MGSLIGCAITCRLSYCPVAICFSFPTGLDIERYQTGRSIPADRDLAFTALSLRGLQLCGHS